MNEDKKRQQLGLGVARYLADGLQEMFESFDAVARTLGANSEEILQAVHSEALGLDIEAEYRVWISESWETV
jgi:hypothetical protein